MSQYILIAIISFFVVYFLLNTKVKIKTKQVFDIKLSRKEAVELVLNQTYFERTFYCVVAKKNKGLYQEISRLNLEFDGKDYDISSRYSDFYVAKISEENYDEWIVKMREIFRKLNIELQ